MRITQEGEILALRRLITIPTIKARLGKAVTTKTEQTFTFLDLVEATFGGYAEVNPVIWSPPGINADARAESDENMISFTATGAALPQTIYWLVLVQDDPETIARVIAAHKFDPALTMYIAGNTIAVDLAALCDKFIP